LKTRGRARFNVRAWQLDLAKRAKLLAAATPEPGPSTPDVVKLSEVMEKLGEFSENCRFEDAVDYLKSLPADPEGATRASLLSVTEACVAFLSDLEDDLRKQSMPGDFLLKSGDSVSRIAINADGEITTVDAGGATHSANWSDFSADALISLHRAFVANPKSEFERVRRHESAISYDWLAGNRERALAAAAVLSQGSPEFKQHWEAIASGLPE